MKEKYRSDFLSRQKMIKNNFELYYYNDTSQIHVNPHFHENYEIQFFLEGDATCLINGKRHILRPHDIVVVPPGTRHFNRVQSTKPYRRFIFWISKDYLGQIVEEDAVYGLFVKEAEKEHYFWHISSVSFSSIQARLVNLLEGLQMTNFGHDTLVALALRGLLLRLNQGIFEIINPDRIRKEQSLNERVLEYIQMHLSEDLSLEKLASVFFVSKYHISHLFTSQMGISLHQYVIKKRLEQVRVAILANEDLSQAIESAGFGNYSSFFRAFQKEYGMSPTDYRKKRSLENLDQKNTPSVYAVEE